MRDKRISDGKVFSNDIDDRPVVMTTEMDMVCIICGKETREFTGDFRCLDCYHDCRLQMMDCECPRHSRSNVIRTASDV